MSLRDVKVGHKFICRKPELYGDVPRDRVLEVTKVKHEKRKLEFKDFPFDWFFYDNQDHFLPFAEDHVELTPMEFQYRHIESHPMTVNYGKPYKWETIDANKMNDIKAYIQSGYNYQVRTLFSSVAIAKELECIMIDVEDTGVKERIEKLILTLKG